jgi:hypothetical protein
MKYFPKIKFVNVLPTKEIEQHLTKKQVIRGLFGGYRNDYQIYVLNRKGKITTLLHELGHWLIEVAFKDESDKWHKLYDKCCRFIQRTYIDTRKKLKIEYKPQKWEQFQIDTRKERCAKRFKEPLLFFGK